MYMGVGERGMGDRFVRGLKRRVNEVVGERLEFGRGEGVKEVVGERG